MLYTMDIDFTPSEIDDLETAELPSPEQPKGFWTIKRERSYLYASFPGQTAERHQPPPQPPGTYLYLAPGSLPKRDPFQKTLSEEACDEALFKEYEGPPQEREEDLPGPQQDTACPPPYKLRHQRQPQLRGRMGSVQDPDQSPPPPRRSARIAGMKRPAAPLPSQAMPNKKSRGRAAPKAAAVAAEPTAQETRRRRTRPTPARAPAEIEPETRPKRGRRRPKENGPNTRSTVAKKKATRIPAPDGAGRGGAAATDTPRRRRGRPRKNE